MNTSADVIFQTNLRLRKFSNASDTKTDGVKPSVFFLFEVFVLSCLLVFMVLIDGQNLI